jgi:hypothetical protein
MEVNCTEPSPIDIKRRKNRLLKFCYLPATSAAHNRLLFLLQPFAVLMKQTRQAVCTVKQSIFVDVYASPSVIVSGLHISLQTMCDELTKLN